MRTLTPILALCCTLSLAYAASPEESTHDLNRLHQAIQKSLPAGWSVRILPSAQERSSVPTLIVSRDEKVMGSFIYPNPPPGPPEVTLCSIEFHFTAMPYISPEEYKTISELNGLKNNKRRTFEKRLSNIKWGWMGGRPFPPTAYQPRNDEEEQLVQAYAFLWQETEPVPLPDLRYKTLSFRSDLAWQFDSENETTGKEIAAVRKTVVARFEKYNNS